MAPLLYLMYAEMDICPLLLTTKPSLQQWKQAYHMDIVDITVHSLVVRVTLRVVYPSIIVQ